MKMNGIKRIISAVTAIAIICAMQVFAFAENSSNVSESEFYAIVADVEKDAASITINFSQNLSDSVDFGGIKIKDSYAKDVKCGAPTKTGNSVIVPLMQELNEKMQYAVILPSGIKSANDVVLSVNDIYFNATESSKSKCPELKHLTGDGALDKISGTEDLNDGEHGKVIKVNNDGSTTINKQIRGSYATGDAIPFWDSAECDESVMEFDVLSSNIAHNFDYRLYDNKGVMMGYFFFDRGGNFVVANGSGNMSSDQDFENTAEYSNFSNVTAYDLGANSGEWHSITILFDKNNHKLKYWIDKKFVAETAIILGEENTEYGNQISELRISNTGVTKSETGYIYLDNINVGCVNSEPVMGEVVQAIEGEKEGSTEGNGTDIVFDNNTYSKEYILQYDVKCSKIGTNGGLRALVRSNGAVMGGAYNDKYNNIYALKSASWLELDSKETYNTYGDNSIRNYQPFYNAVKLGRTNTFTYSINPTTQTVKTWVDGQYLGQSASNGADMALKMLTIKNYSVDDDITVYNIKVGYPKENAEYVKGIKFISENGEFNQYSANIDESVGAIDVYFSDDITYSDEIKANADKKVKLADKDNNDVNVSIESYDSNSKKMRIKINDVLKKGHAYKISIKDMPMTSGERFENFSYDFQLAAPQMNAVIYEQKFDDAELYGSEQCLVLTGNDDNSEKGIIYDNIPVKGYYTGQNLVLAFDVIPNIKNNALRIITQSAGNLMSTSWLDCHGTAIMRDTPIWDNLTVRENYDAISAFKTLYDATDTSKSDISYNIKFYYDMTAHTTSMFVNDVFVGENTTWADGYADGILNQVNFYLYNKDDSVKIDNLRLGYEQRGAQNISIVKSGDGKAAAKLEFKKLFYDGDKITLLCSVYKDGKLKAVAPKVIDVNTEVTSGNQAFLTDYIAVEKGDEIKVFLWEDMNKVAPVRSGISETIQ